MSAVMPVGPDNKPIGTVANPFRTDEPPFVPVGAHQQDTTISAATVLTPPATATKVRIQPQGQDVMYTLDGTTPTASLGFILYAGDPAIVEVSGGIILTVIEAAAGGVIAYQWGK